MKNRELIRRLHVYIKPYRYKLMAAMLSMILVAALGNLQVYMVKPLLDKIFINKDKEMLALLPFALIGLFLIKGVFYFAYSYLMDNVGESVIKKIRIDLFSHIQAMELAFFHNMPTGELISRIMNDVALIRSAMSKALVGVLKDLIQAIGLIGLIFYLDWKLALMSFIFLPMATYPIVTFGRKYRRLSTKNQKIRAVVSNILHESITGNRIVKAFGTEPQEIARFTGKVEDLFRNIMRDVKVRSLSHPIMELLGGVGIALIIWYGGKQVINGTSTPGTFISFLTALVTIYDPIKQVSKVNNALQKGMAASERIFQMLDIQPAIVDPPEPKQLSAKINSIELKDVSFRYGEENDILNSINLHVKTDEVLAIVGPSGSGKTTLVNLIPRFYDVTAGSIAINGCDIREISLSSLRSHISIVTQDTILFNDTIRNNISYGCAGCSEQMINEAARAAHALDFINELPQGFDTVIGESGVRLSGGQRQRVSIARALLKDSPILILDEATSALDTESERAVQQALDNLMKNRTTLVIAHRLSTIKYADRIIVLKDGDIVESGSHDALLSRNGVYSMLHAMQFSD